MDPLSRQGWDVYRDAVNTPAFLKALPDIGEKRGLDIGCGEGHNTRLFAQRGARMSAIDIAPAFIRFAADVERKEKITASDMPSRALWSCPLRPGSSTLLPR